MATRRGTPPSGKLFTKGVSSRPPPSAPTPPHMMAASSQAGRRGVAVAASRTRNAAMATYEARNSHSPGRGTWCRGGHGGVEHGGAGGPQDEADRQRDRAPAPTGPDDGRDDEPHDQHDRKSSQTADEDRPAVDVGAVGLAMNRGDAADDDDAHPRTPSNLTSRSPSRSEPRRAPIIRGPPRCSAPAFPQGYKRPSGSPVRRLRCGEGHFRGVRAAEPSLRGPSPGSRPARRTARGRRSARGPCAGTGPRWTRRFRTWTR